MEHLEIDEPNDPHAHRTALVVALFLETAVNAGVITEEQLEQIARANEEAHDDYSNPEMDGVESDCWTIAYNICSQYPR